jgi:hypothetical protein
MIPIHPDDVLLYTEISAAMRRVALKYNLPLHSISGYPMPRSGMSDRLGDCSHDGHIRLVMRCTVDGQWETEPRTPELVWETAAHELAHLKYFNHGESFQSFCEELTLAMRNQQQDHRQKVIDKILKMQASRQSESQLGNQDAAEAFAGAVNRMMLEYELNPSDLDYARANDDDPVIEMRVNTGAYGIERKKTRSAWEETLASSIASAHLCKILIRPGSNDIWFVGTRSHALVAEYVFGTMVPYIAKASKKAEIDYWYSTGCGRGINNQAKGYRASWIDGFITRLWQRFREAREESIAAAAVCGNTSSETALIRLDGALTKVRQYMNDKFSHSRAASRAGALNHKFGHHAEGRAAGRAAANQIALGRRGVTGGSATKLIGG